MKLTEANLNKGRIGVELEMLIRKDVVDFESSLGQQFKSVLITSGFTRGDDSTIVRHGLSKDVYYDDFETSNQEIDGANWAEVYPRLNRVLAWLKQKDQVWVDRRSKKVYVDTKDTSNPDMLRVFLPRAKMPNNPSCGLHLHFHVEDWFRDLEHAVSFVQLWNYAMDVFREEVNPARYEKGDESYTPQGEDYAQFVPIKIPDSSSIDLLQKEWSQMSEIGGTDEEKNAYMIKRILKWMAKNRWTAMNLTKVDIRKDIEFRFMHGTLNIETITHWLSLLSALIEAAELGDVKNFRRYLAMKEPDLAAEHERRASKMSVADTSHSNVWNPPAHASRAVRRLIVPPGEELEPPESRQEPVTTLRRA